MQEPSTWPSCGAARNELIEAAAAFEPIDMPDMRESVSWKLSGILSYLVVFRPFDFRSRIQIRLRWECVCEGSKSGMSNRVRRNWWGRSMSNAASCR